ncbi:MAG: hypothetical protein H7A35_12570 [Planctomycetales bacterium]|nr:hypothetical protein [bacterium]UNM07681.1 MAG: hypothetical protein H7A35_12570 [Planctomycetales bacterium]
MTRLQSTFNIMWLAILMVAASCLPALAAEQLQDLPGTSFNCEAHPWLEASPLGAESQAGYAAAEKLGMQVLNLSGIELHWPKSERSLLVMSGQYGDMEGSGGRQLETSICVGLSDRDMQVINLRGQRIPGFLSKLSAWPTQRGQDARLIIVVSFSDGYEDSQVLAFSVDGSGNVESVDTTNAHTQWGEYQLADLDDNGSYELLCYRNLDGSLGGLSYRSVRGYDAASNSYVPAAQQHKRFFELERDWLDWVIDTRPQVEANPMAYIQEEGTGAYYQAQYNGVSYGFDTIIFIDNAGYDREVARELGMRANDAFRKVRNYRDELNNWLSGGEMPATWGMR